MEIPAQPTRFELLDAMRGVAALWVLSFHFHEQFVPYGRFADWLTARGFVGIMVFFVISGYSITASMNNALRSRERPGHFLYRRFRRVFVPYWGSLVVALAMPWLGAKVVGAIVHSPIPVVYHCGDWGFWDWLSVATLTQGIGRYASSSFIPYAPINAVAWTLAIEIQFYCIAAIAMANPRHLGRILGGVTLVCLPMTFIEPLFRYGICLPYWPLFALGIGLRVLDQRGLAPARVLGLRRWQSIALLVAGLPAVLLVLRASSITAAMPWVALAFAVWFWIGLDFKGGLHALVASRWPPLAWAARLALLLGAMSYTIYLLHDPVTPWVFRLLYAWISPDSRLMAPLMVALSLLLFYPFYRYCEKPFVKPRVRKIDDQR